MERPHAKWIVERQNIPGVSIVGFLFYMKQMRISVKMIDGSLIPEINLVVYKISCAGKYVIILCNSLMGSVRMLKTDCRLYAGSNKKTFYRKFFEFIYETEEDQCYVEILSHPGVSLYRLLVDAQDILTLAKEDPNCLNVNFEPYTPFYREETGKYGWMDKGSVEKFLSSKK